MSYISLYYTIHFNLYCALLLRNYIVLLERMHVQYSVFELRAKPFWTGTLVFGQPTLIYCLCEGQVDRKIYLLLTL